MEYSKLYIEHIKQLLDRLMNTQWEAIHQASDYISKAIAENHSIYIFGASHAGILAQEMFYRTGGLAVINPILPKEVMLDIRPITQTSQMERLEGYGKIVFDNSGIKENDILIIHSVSGRNTISIDMALSAKKKGIKLIVITNMDYSKKVSSRHLSGKKLFELADVVIDNCGEFEDSCILVDGMDQKVAPTSTVMGAGIVNAIVIQVVEKLLKRNIDPPVFHSANVDGGDEYNKKILGKYKEHIFYM